MFIECVLLNIHTKDITLLHACRTTTRTGKNLQKQSNGDYGSYQLGTTLEHPVIFSVYALTKFFAPTDWQGGRRVIRKLNVFGNYI